MSETSDEDTLSSKLLLCFINWLCFLLLNLDCKPYCLLWDYTLLACNIITRLRFLHDVILHFKTLSFKPILEGIIRPVNKEHPNVLGQPHDPLPCTDEYPVVPPEPLGLCYSLGLGKRRGNKIDDLREFEACHRFSY